MKKLMYDEAIGETKESFGGDDLAASVFLNKYAIKDDQDYLHEFTLDDLRGRLKKGMIRAESEYFKKKEDDVAHLKTEYKKFFRHFLFGGRILYALENPFDDKSTFSNCYSSDIGGDSIEEIFETAKRQARVFSKGGGIGFDISVLRPKGAKVNNSARKTTGAVSFMSLFSHVTNLIGQNGRRGALMLTIQVTHPDVIDFIKVKGGHDKEAIKHANISVKITDKFMQALEANSDWEMSYTLKDGDVYRVTEKAKIIWDLLVESNYNGGEPGILFWDRTMEEDPSSTFNETRPICTNPCGELPLEKGGACVLGSIDLSTLVEDEFTPQAIFDMKTFTKCVHMGIRSLDNIVEMNLERQPLEENRIAAERGRRVGLGITGLADMLIKLNLKYDTQEALDMVDKVFKVLKIESIKASIDLAEERGCFPLIKSKDSREKLIGHKYYDLIRDNKEYMDKFKKYGIRNIGLNTVAPNGSLSIVNQSSSGIEPIFRLSYERDVISANKSGKKEMFVVYHPLVKHYDEVYGKGAHLKNHAFVTSDKIDWKKRIELQAICQKYISASISSTVNLPKDVTKETIDQIYRYAWKNRLKGVTVYRDGCREGVLNENKTGGMMRHEVLSDVKFPDEGGSLFKVIRSEGKKWYVFYTVDDMTKLPTSIFVNTNSTETKIMTENILEHFEKLAEKHIKKEYILKLKEKYHGQNNINKIARTLSMLLRHRVPIIEIVKTIEDIKPPITSFIYRIKSLLSEFLVGQYSGDACPDCGSQMVFSEGCKLCKNCGFGKCG